MARKKYRIQYLGTSITQIKTLISSKEYKCIIKPLQNCKFDIELELANKKTRKNKERFEELTTELARIKEILKPYNIEYFVEGSPLFHAIRDGQLVLPKQQGGTHLVKISLV